jgi:hypothetical protein
MTPTRGRAQGALTFVVKHARELNIGVFGSKSFGELALGGYIISGTNPR